MKRISKVEIRYYRSIKILMIDNLNDLNIFSGGNDVGKSNVLKALDLFFNEKIINFPEEFNVQRKAAIRRQRERQLISVKVWFKNNTYKNLPSEFTIRKTWDKTGKLINTQDNLTPWLDEKKDAQGNYTITPSQAKTSLSLYLNRFNFKYIRAIKDDTIFNELLIELYNAIIENNKDSLIELEETLSVFNNKLKLLANTLSDTFYKISHIKSDISIPTSVNELARRLSVTTDVGTDSHIPLFNRGDGIRMQYIPSILNFISEVEVNKWHIWAIDEPETSCEYVKAERMAKDFANVYSKSNQIFLSSHSFHFITLSNSNISRYRISMGDDGLSYLQNVNEDLLVESELQNDLGVFHLLNGLQKVYDEYIEKQKLLADNIETLRQLNKPILLFEGKSDRILFRKAFGKLCPDKVAKFNYADEADKKEGAVIGEGANSLYGFLSSHIPKIAMGDKKIIAIFDNDEEGRIQFSQLASKNPSYVKININNIEILKHKSYNVYVFCLVPPDFRTNFVCESAKHSYLTTELLLQDINIPEEKRTIIPHTSPQLFCFKANSDKVAFAKSISEDSDFSGFGNTIQIILSLMDRI
ncbi:hypothetical protein A3BBH6_26560 [Alistipes onderdonkii subsp. vulgaris]|uniref:ATP-dependent nuclease n=1 Tax=Alistipes onderdonkii TaxID=328813 RepID=UPI0011428330|nr:AAA family ATPase [Alistipes onderdonkii]BBL02420.1 hypothetical protein A3BBH6_26560 [Alistipes onderdonkii subsp. vulgaris]